MSATQSTHPSVILADAARGMAQQMVFWGHDVNHPDGNALVRFGFKRSLSPGLKGTSCYSMAWENGVIELHGAVASWTPCDGKTGCVFCRDLAAISLWLRDRPPVPGQEYGEPGTTRQRWEAFQPFLRWLVSYEIWITEALESDWRERTWKTLKRLPRGKPWIAPALAVKWWRLALTGNPPRPKSLFQSI